MRKRNFTSSLLSFLFVVGIAAGSFWYITSNSLRAHAAENPPILLLHGFTSNCGPAMTNAANYLQGMGATTISLGLYNPDTGCDASILNSYGPTSYGSIIPGCTVTVPPSVQAADMARPKDTNYPIENLGYHLAWWIYQNFSLKGQAVDLLAHSMGGLVMRTAIAETVAQQQQGCNPAYNPAGLGPLPPTLLVNRVVTISTPFQGTQLANLDPVTQAMEMAPNSTFLQALSAQTSAGGAAWLTFGEACPAFLQSDLVVSARSAQWVGANEAFAYKGCTWVHTTIEKDMSNTQDQTVQISQNTATALIGTHSGCSRSLASAAAWFKLMSTPLCTN